MDDAFATYFARWHHAIRFHLTASDSENLHLNELLDLAGPSARAAWDGLALGYTEPRGGSALREAVARTYDTVAPDDILCVCGAQEGIFVAMHALLGAGDHAIVITPNYQATDTVPRRLCDVTSVALQPDQGWALDLDEVRAAIRPATRLVSINFPNNPTGRILPRANFQALIALCRQYGLWLFSDEVYRMIERDPALRLPQAADAYERGISLNTLSKAYGLPGLRIGWIACRDRALLARMEGLRHVTTGCNAGPSEALATIALEARGPILARNRAIADRNRTMLGAWFAERPALFDWTEPDGGVTAFPRYHGPEGVEQFAHRLISGHGILVAPSSLYRGAGSQDRFRVGFGRADLAAGLRALDACLDG